MQNIPNVIEDIYIIDIYTFILKILYEKKDKKKWKYNIESILSKAVAKRNKINKLSKKIL